jgi:iron complex outermembrane receptor protein
MRRFVRKAALALIALAAGARAARAQQPELSVPEVRVEDTRLAAQPQPTEDSPFVTVIHVTAPGTEVRSLAETLAESAGVQIRQTGGLGAYTAVSIRGSSSAQVAVFLDGVPLNRGAVGGVDLSTVPLDRLERIEVYRGQVPAELGGQAIGGAINLVTRGLRGASESAASASYGSFGTRKLDLYRGQQLGLWDATAFLSYAGSEGDFGFRNLNGTTENSADDFADYRRNNDFDQLDAHLSARRRGLQLSAQTFWKQQGVPGTEFAQIQTARLDSLRSALSAQAERNGLAGVAALSGHAQAFVITERRHFSDPAADMVGPTDQVDWSLAVGGSGRAQLAVGQHQLLALAPEVTAEWQWGDDRLAQASSIGAWRVQGALALTDTIALASDRVVLEPVVRADLYDTRGSAQLPGVTAPAMGDIERSDAVLSPRLGLRVRTPLEGLVVKGNVGRYFRLPTFYDLYANLGYFVGRPDLRPESSWNGDVGAVYERALGGGDARVVGEAAFFASSTQDLIAYQTGVRTAIPVNVSGATGRGVESSLALTARSLSLTANYTFLDLRADDTGLRVAGRPAHEGYVRVGGDRALGWRRWRAWSLGGYYETRLNAGLYADAANTIEFPLRTYHAVGVHVTRGAFTLGFDVKNLLDAQLEQVFRRGSACPDQRCLSPIADFGGYPLPGRAFYATLSWKE